MSLNITPLKVVEVRDPRTILREKEYAILKGGSQVTWKPYTTSSISSSSIQISTPPPNPKVFVDRKLYFQLPVRILLTCAVPNAFPLLRAGYDAPRAFPISSAIETLSVNINNTGVSMNMGDVIQALLRFNTDQYLKEHDYSMTPSCMDQSQEYIDLVGSNRNPLGQYGDANDEDVTGRGGFANFRIVSNTPSQAIIDCVFTEPLFISPFYWGKGNASAFIGVQTMDWNITFQARAGFRMWSHAIGGLNAPGLITGTQVAFSNYNQIDPTPFSFGSVVPQMLFNFITPQQLQNIPSAMEYPYFSINKYTTDYSAIAPGASTTLVSSSIKLNSIPRRIYVFARNSNAVLSSSPSYTDTYLAINKMVVNWNNGAGQFSSATQRDLYKMSVKNHCNLSWSQWSGGPVFKDGSLTTLIGSTGSIVSFEMSTDIGLTDIECPGLLGQYQIQVDVDVTNVNQVNNITPSLYIVVVSEGVFNILNGSAITQIGVVSSQNVLDAKENLSDYIDYEMIQDVNGGNFMSGITKFGQNLFDRIKGFAKKAYEIGKKIAPYAKTGFEIAKTVAPFLLAAGEDEYNDNGGVLVGGKMMKRRNLQSRLRRA